MSTPNARFIARAYIDNQKIDIKDHWVVLQSTTPGNCQITVKTEAKQFALVSVDLGWGDMIDKVFIGYVERVMPAVNGWYTLFCRELSASLALNYSVMLRHPTLKQVLDELSQLTGLEFVVPDKTYAETAIPCFYCDSSGYAMLDNIGRSFRIDDFIWQQQGNGKIYVGSYQDSFWADKPIVIPNNLMTNHQAGRTATIPAAPMIRPNVLANGSRIKTVEFKETQMTITW
ncbi:hypothetical protein ORI98_06040 [Shewanella sp. ULN5]|uniref:hypothetical protein n=1 Tax=Shewanella sp. ULN5 TaxID=2994678 RepID=UPI00273F4CDD|nr:hypothetical protein [Shewanella sp. ULN5]MDP5145994.1 hypothetical protein [Shewanella sp. ULN5]